MLNDEKLKKLQISGFPFQFNFYFVQGTEITRDTKGKKTKKCFVGSYRKKIIRRT